MPRRAVVTGSSWGTILGEEDVTATSAADFMRTRLGAYVGEKEHQQVPFLPWALNIPTASGDVLDFSLYPFQRELYEDEAVYARLLALMKATQVGVSEWLVRWALFFPDKHGDRALYLFPASRQLKDFSADRVKPLVKSEYLSRRVPRDSVDNMMLKTVGRGKIYFRGSQNATDLDSIPAGVLAMDEYDDIVQKNIPRALKRLSGVQSRGLVRRVGVPRYTELGIHAEYLKGDQRQWHVTCAKCSKELPLAFYADDDRAVHYVDVERGTLVCANCEAPIERRWVAEGRWGALYPDRDYRTYHMSRLIVPTAPIAEIITESKAIKPFEVQEFWNSTLGLPFDPAEGRLALEAIAAAISAGGDYMQGSWEGGYTGSGIVTMGVDVASVRDLNVKISLHETEQRKRTLYVGPVESFDQLATMMQAFRVNIAAIDANPDGRLARGFCDLFPGRAYRVGPWSDNPKDVFSLSEEDRHVMVRRTDTIAATLDMIRRQNNLLPVNLPGEYAKHLRSAVLKKEEDEKGRVVVWFEKTGDDDYLQAEAYDLVATHAWWWLYLRDQESKEVLRPLDQMLEFQRSRVADPNDMTYSPGYPEEESWGADEQDWDPDTEF